MAMIHHLLAPNPGPLTLEGTNTLIVAPLSGTTIVVDPGPDDEDHLAAIEAVCANGIDEIWYTHHHADHTEAGPRLAEAFGATIRAWDPELATEPFTDGQVFERDATRVTVFHVPGHTDDSMAFLLEGQGPAPWLATGDTVLGRGSSVIAAPDGNLTNYLASLARLQEIVAEHGVRKMAPGHGPIVQDPSAWLRTYVDHRAERLEQVRSAVAAGASTAEDVVDAVYGGLPPELREAAAWSAQAQLDHLRRA